LDTRRRRRRRSNGAGVRPLTRAAAAGTECTRGVGRCQGHATWWLGGPRTPQATADPGTQAIRDQAPSPRPTPARLISTVACDSRTSVLARTLATDQSAKRSQCRPNCTHHAGPINNAHFVFQDHHQQQQQLPADKQRLDAHQ